MLGWLVVRKLGKYLVSSFSKEFYMFVFALSQWCKVIGTPDSYGYIVELSDGGISVVLFEEVCAICKE